jgi:hypothetical protein
MKLTKIEKNALNALVNHVRQDISFGAGGTFALNPGMDDRVDKKELKKVLEAIRIIQAITS